ncbi:hypothetical protein L7F22_003061 [Adiantum nelumboides]|nr:hypothetical protein [Adiantum nelumboides]
MAQASLSHDSEGRKTNSGQEAAYPPQSSSIAFPEDPFSDTYKRSQAQQLHNQPQSGGSINADSIADWAKATRFTVLNHFSHVTNVARNGAHNLLSSPLFQQQLGDNGDESAARSSTASLATSLLQHGPIGPFGPNDPSWKHSELAQKSGTGDFDSAHVYLARWAKIVAEEGEANRRREAEARRAIHKQSMDDVEESELGNFEVWNRLPHIDRPEPTRSRDNAISLQAWKSLFDQEGKPIITRREMKVLVFQQGFGKGKERAMGTHWDQLDPRAECWSFLLNAQSWDPSIGQEGRRKLWNERSEEYWGIKTQYLTSMQSSSGTEKKVRKEEEEVSQEEAEEEQKRAEEATFWKEQRHRVHVDCLRVDRKIPFFSDYDNEAYGIGGGEDGDAYQNVNANAHAQRLEEILLAYVAWDKVREAKAEGNEKEEERGQLGGYVQGMSDLCAPLYAVCHGDEAKTFWLLVGLMKRARRNFYANQSGMKMQLLNLQKLISIMDAGLYGHLEEIDGLNLFFCFRWLLVCFKREFDYPDILILWEGIWAAEVDEYDGKDANDHISPTSASLSNHFQIFIALAILEQQRDVIVKYLHHFDEVLQYMNGLSGQIDVDRTLAEAQVLCLSLKQLINQQDKINHQSQSGTGKGDEAATIAAAAIAPVDDEIKALVGIDASESSSVEKKVISLP